MCCVNKLSTLGCYPLWLDKGLKGARGRFGWANLPCLPYMHGLSGPCSVWEIPPLAIWWLLSSLFLTHSSPWYEPNLGANRKTVSLIHLLRSSWDAIDVWRIGLHWNSKQQQQDIDDGWTKVIVKSFQFYLLSMRQVLATQATCVKALFYLSGYDSKFGVNDSFLMKLTSSTCNQMCSA